MFWGCGFLLFVVVVVVVVVVLLLLLFFFLETETNIKSTGLLQTDK